MNQNAARPMHNMEELQAGIVRQAAEDYLRALKCLKKNKRGYSSVTKIECEKFFRSEWYRKMTDIPGEWLIRELRKKAGYNE